MGTFQTSCPRPPVGRSIKLPVHIHLTAAPTVVAVSFTGEVHPGMPTACSYSDRPCSLGHGHYSAIKFVVNDCGSRCHESMMQPQKWIAITFDDILSPPVIFQIILSFWETLVELLLWKWSLRMDVIIYLYAVCMAYNVGYIRENKCTWTAWKHTVRSLAGQRDIQLLINCPLSEVRIFNGGRIANYNILRFDGKAF